MVRPILGPENGEEDEEDYDEENFVCPHLSNPSPPPPPPPASEPSSSASSSSNDQDQAGGVSGAEVAGTVLKTGAVAVGSAATGATVATAGLTAVGFSSSGVVGGSIAAGLQASIGNVAAGSAFATAQSIGATGGFAVLGPVGLACGLIGGAIYGGYKLYQYNSNNQSNDRPVIASGSSGSDDKKPPPPNDKSHEKIKPPEEQAKPLGGKNKPLVRGVNICEECWLKLQIWKYKKLSKKGAKDANL